MAPRDILVDTAVEQSPVPVPVHALRFNLRTFLTPSENISLPLDPTTHRHLHTLEAKPFNHLSVWAYLAFAFIVLALVTVIAYATYSCYHSSRKKMEAGMPLPDLPSGRDRAAWEDLETPDTMVKTDHTLVGIGEKGKLERIRGNMNVHEMTGIGGRHKKIGSESERNTFYLPSNSLSSMSNVNDASFELNNHYLSSPPLAHTSDKAATYIPFHLPPPPPSPTPAHKEHVERQYRGRAQRSPVSPSPSFSLATASLPPITPRNPSFSTEGSKNSWSGRTFTGNSQSFRKPKDPGSSKEAPSTQFDSNNIRFVPHRNPFMAQSAVALWNEPKLSPIHGSIISNANTSGSSSVEESSFSQAVLAASRSPPPVTSRKRSKTVLVHDAQRRGDDKENVDPSVLDRSYGTNTA